MSQTVHKYRVYCTDNTPHYAYVWGTVPPTVCPDEGAAIDTNLTTIVESIGSNTVVIDNIDKSAFGELNVVNITPVVQISFTYNNSTQLLTTNTTGSGSVINADHMAVVSTGAAINSSAILQSLIPIKYRSGQGVIIRFSGLFTSGVSGNTQMIGAFGNIDGLGFGFNGPDFGIFQKKNNINTWINQTSWNLDKLDGTGSSGVTIDFSQGKGNIFQLKYQFLGFGGLTFYVENPGTSEYIKVHIITYSNSQITPNFNVPSFPLRIESENTTNNSNIIIKSSSMMGGIEGKLIYNGPKFVDIWNSVAVVKDVETFIAGWQIKSTFNSHINLSLIYLIKMTISTGHKDRPQILRLRKGSTLTSPVWEDINTDSVVQKLISGTWNNDGTLISMQIVPGKSSLYEILFEISNRSIFCLPGENIIITLEGINGSGRSTGSLSWLEDQ